jgi:hypothetical protein
MEFAAITFLMVLFYDIVIFPFLHLYLQLVHSKLFENLFGGFFFNHVEF